VEEIKEIAIASNSSSDKIKKFVVIPIVIALGLTLLLGVACYWYNKRKQS